MQNIELKVVYFKMIWMILIPIIFILFVGSLIFLMKILFNLRKSIVYLKNGLLIMYIIFLPDILNYILFTSKLKIKLILSERVSLKSLRRSVATVRPDLESPGRTAKP